MIYRIIKTNNDEYTIAYSQETGIDRELTLHEIIINDLYDEKEELEKQNKSLIRQNKTLLSLMQYVTLEDWDSDYVCKELESIGINVDDLFEM